MCRKNSAHPYILSAISFGFLCLCDPFESLEASEGGGIRKEILAAPMNVMDPNFDPQWDWTENRTYNLYYRGPTGIVEQPNVTLPYFSDAGPTNIFHSDIPGARDIAPQDGWVLLYRDFGTPNRAAQPPRIVLYNRYRGLLRLFYYNSYFNETFSHGVVTLSWRSAPSSNGFAVFTFDDSIHHTLDDFNKDKDIELSVSRLEPGQWSYADFNVIGYDPVLPDDAKFLFQIRGCKVGDINLSGNIAWEQVVSQSTSNDLSLGKVIDVAGKAYARFKSLNGFFNDVKDTVTRLSAKPEKDRPWYFNILKALGVTSVLSNGVPVLGAASVIFQGIFGAKNQAQPVRYRGQLSITGQIKFQSDIISFLMRVPGARHLRQDNLPFYDKPLGVFNLRTRPEILYSFKRKGEERVPTDCNPPEGAILWVYDVSRRFTAPFGKIDVAINPFASLGAVTLEAALVPFPEAPDTISSQFADGYFPINYYHDGNILITEKPSCDYNSRKAAQRKDPDWKWSYQLNSENFTYFMPLARKVALRVTVNGENVPSDFTPITFLKTYVPRYVFVGEFDPRNNVDITREDIVNGQEKKIFASEMISVKDCSVRNSGKLILEARKSIVIKSNFAVEAGGYLRVKAY